ncbi:hypothetical protein MKW98_020698 [Papaver atlanticum]|uniref:MORF/ORRM1/DAG-like MORF domain-containing protein n=1 Tax=Papaver atlanticum TaxID=357466 RepID=A0AAD4XUW3_9MAGN|nr:hypothetical protein MKW98_020698 [Papaver atlanticum]
MLALIVLSAATLSTHAATTTPSSLVNDTQSNGKYSHPEEETEEETDWPPGCDLEHWLVVMEKPEGEPTRDEIIDTYIETLSKVLGSEEEARMKIYSVSTRCYFAFGALVSEELSYKIEKLPGVRWVLPDSYVNEGNKDYGGEPFINGKAVPYDPKYHEVWIHNQNRQHARERDKQLNSSPGGDVQPNTGGLQHDTHAQNNMGSTPPAMHTWEVDARYYNNNMPNNDGGECRHAPKQNGGMSFQGGPPEDFSSNGNYQLGRATILDN